ncbi:sugar phosphate isomerase/epimerase family protein [Acutalibacter caecimuris]|uniref:sugar phosphate isomerase/epimerase family protein n=1 Tax=Acutalibacter caecimuris TaxID=3093657 RepID=UPI002AC92356|nr:sugar phosphate isomerase/epimerase family protein [Acutalibacter sp. M00118]
MLFSSPTEGLAHLYDQTTAVRMLAQAGFEAFDLSLFTMTDPKDPFNQPDYREQALALRAVADAAGIICNQSHAPFPSSVGDPTQDEERFQTIVRAMEIAAILGAKIIVVHPMHHLDYRTHAQETTEMNLAFYRRLLPYCQQFGIKIACENMWQYNQPAHRIRDSACSRPQEFCDYIDQVGSPWLVGCLDVGHAALTDEDLPAYVRALGPQRLQALHVHDNDLWADSHTLPFVTGKVDFAGLTAALKEIGYQGDLTLEADAFLLKFPLPLVPEAVRLMACTARYLAQEAGKQDA